MTEGKLLGVIHLEQLVILQDGLEGRAILSRPAPGFLTKHGTDLTAGRVFCRTNVLGRRDQIRNALEGRLRSRGSAGASR